MPRPYPAEFRADVVAVARRGDAPISQIARDFGITESCLCNWLHAAEVAELVLRHRLEIEVTRLDDPALWGTPINDERYVITSRR